MLLEEINSVELSRLKSMLTRCCGSSAWVEKMVSRFPVRNEEALLADASLTWYACNRADWLEAFTHHPKIGDIHSLKEKFSTTAEWAKGEQAAVKQTSQQVLEDLAEANRVYEKKFGYIFIVFATGKSAEEMLDMLQQRLANTPENELRIAMEEQLKITILRLKKLLSP